MIISFAHNYIYFRTKKTASTTIETALCDTLTLDDFIAGHRFRHVPGADRRTDTMARFADFGIHVPACEIRERLPDEFWNTCYKFTSERHPYEKAISLAYFRFGSRLERGRPSGNFPELLDEAVKKGNYAGAMYYTINGLAVVDDFIRYESLGVDLQRVSQRIGIAIPDELPKAKTTYRQDQRPARDILTAAQKETVYSFCRTEFELLGYER
jgi:hypothetical protein